MPKRSQRSELVRHLRTAHLVVVDEGRRTPRKQLERLHDAIHREEKS